MKLKWRKVLGISAILGAAGAFLFTRANFVQTSLSIGEKPTLEQTLTFSSFSEVENAKALMRELADRFLEEVRTVRAQSYLENGAGDEVSRRNEITKATQRLLNGLGEFEGTAEEGLVTREILQLFSSSKQVGPWLDIYISFVYRNPTDDLVSKSAQFALDTSLRAGREAEVVAAFEHVLRIPLRFTGKDLLATIMAKNTGTMHLASEVEADTGQLNSGGFL